MPWGCEAEAPAVARDGATEAAAAEETGATETAAASEDGSRNRSRSRDKEVGTTATAPAERAAVDAGARLSIFGFVYSGVHNDTDDPPVAGCSGE